MMRQRSVARRWLWLIAVLLLSACSPSKAPPKVEPPVIDSKPAVIILNTAPATYYTVKEGDNLYSIGLIYDHDYRQLASLNRIRNAHRIYPGQRILIPPSAAVSAIQDHSKTKSASKALPKFTATKNASATPTAATKILLPKPPVTNSVTSGTGTKPTPWVWPAEGELVGAYGKSNKGINIAGKLGFPIRSTADGEVVYSGSGLAGYGKLLILKHRNGYLSAYAHNHKVHVAEGSLVTAGQHISDMGSSGTDRVMLHFELRKKGKPLNPGFYLPKR